MFRIDRMELTNFGCLHGAELDLEGVKLVIIGGDVGEGKTLCLDAIRTVILGSSRGLQVKDRGLLAFNRKKPWVVDLDVRVKKGVIPLRRVKSGLSIRREDEKNTGISEAQLAKLVGVHPTVLENAIETMAAYHMPPKKLRELALDLFGGKSPTDASLTEMGLEDETIRMHALAGNWAAAADHAKKIRLGLKNTYEALAQEEPDEPTVTMGDLEVGAGEIAPEKLDLFEKKIEESEGNLAKLRKVIGSAEKDSSAAVTLLRSQLEAKQTELAEIDPKDLAEQIAKHRESYDEAEVLRKKNDEDLKSLETQMLRFRTDRSQLEMNLRKVEKIPDKHECSVCGQDCTGKIPPSVIENLKEKIQALTEKLQNREAEQKELTPLLKEREEAAEGFAENILELQRRVATVEQIDRDLTDLKARLKEEEKSAKEGTLTEEELGKKRAAAETMGKQIEIAKARLKLVRDYQKERVTYDSGVEKRRKVAERMKKLKGMEDLCRIDKEGSIPGELLGPAIEGLQKAVNWWAISNHPLLEWPITIDEEFNLSVPHGPLTLLSGSERWRVGIAVSAAFAGKTGLGFLAIDEADRLPGSDWRKRVIAALYLLAQKFSQVWVTIATASPLPAPPKADIAVFHAAGGEIRRV